MDQSCDVTNDCPYHRMGTTVLYKDRLAQWSKLKPLTALLGEHPLLCDFHPVTSIQHCL